MAVLKRTGKASVTPKTGSKKSVTKSVSTLTKSEVGKAAAEYDDISSQIKVLTERKKLLSEKIKEGAIKYGSPDDKGSSFFEVNGYLLGNVSRVTMSLDQEKGIEYLEKKGLGDVIDVVKTINEDKLEKAVGDNRLTISEVESFTMRKSSYSVSVKSVDNMPEVEQSNLSLAAKRK